MKMSDINKNKVAGAMENGTITKSNGDIVKELDLSQLVQAQVDDEIIEVPMQLSLEGVYIDEDPIVTFDVKQFKKGATEGSYLAGFFTALRTAGASEEFIMGILSNKDEVKLGTMQLQAQKDIAKITALLQKDSQM